MRRLDSARVARCPSCPQSWPQVGRLSMPFSSFPPFSSSWRISFYLPPSSVSSFFVMPFSSSFSFRLFSLFSSPFSNLLEVVKQPERVRNWPALSNRRRFNTISLLNAVAANVMIKNIRVEANAAFPGHGCRFRIDAHFLELAHVAPELEGADLEQVAEEDASLQAVLEAKPQLIVFFRLAGRDSHRIELLKHVAPLR